MASPPCDPTIRGAITFIYSERYEESQTFYRDAIRLEHRWQKGPATFFALPGGKNSLGIVQQGVSAAANPPCSARTAGRDSVMLCILVDDVDGAFDRVIEQVPGCPVVQRPMDNARFGIRNALVRDPDGYLVELQRFLDTPVQTLFCGASELDEWLLALASRNGTRPAPWPRVPLGARPRALVVAPHPDDFDIIACTLRLLFRQDVCVRCCVLSCGSGVEDDYCVARGLPPTIESIRHIRAREQRAGCAHFGLQPAALSFLDLEEEEGGGLAERGQTLLTDANRAAFTSFVLAESPDLIFLPAVFESWPPATPPPDPMPNGAGNLGHYRAGLLVYEAAVALGRPTAVFLHRDPKTVSMREDVYTSYGEQDAEWKHQMLRLHDSQHARNMRTRGSGFAERLLVPESAKARALGAPDGVAGVEVFQVELVGHAPDA
jgi:LmbE family N-acetylglucosaminyl deacetylase/catechol 2,3-dioxygenase-like lactoylglutathione lyase family enzyme